MCRICTLARPSVRIVLSKGDPKISWGKISGAHYYYVYRVNVETGTYTQICKTSSLSYTDTAAPKNEVVYYAVSVRGPDRTSMSAYSETVSAMNHTFSAWKTVVPSTHEVEGSRNAPAVFVAMWKPLRFRF